MKDIKILATIGPSSRDKKIIEELSSKGVHLFRINLSHTKLNDVEKIIKQIQSWTNVPVCLDSEGAQVRNQDMESESVHYKKGSIVKYNKGFYRVSFVTKQKVNLNLY